MATTSPDDIWTPDAGDDYALTTDLAAMADTVQDALNTHKNYRVGTNAERLALTGADLFEGLTFYTTDTNALWKYNGGWGLYGFGPFKSTQAQAAGSGTVTQSGSLGALTSISLSQAITTGVACRAKVTLSFKFASTGVGSGAFVGVAGSGATTITPTSSDVGNVQATQQAASQTNTYSASWFISLNAGTTTLAVVGQAAGAGGVRTISSIGLLVEPVSE